MVYLPYSEAIRRALYGPDGFYRRPEGPAGHFRTSVNVSPAFAGALVRLAHRHGLERIVDVGAARGQLLRQVHAIDPGLALHGVEIVERPAGVPAAAEWTQELPERIERSLVIANEWLDVIPVELVQVSWEGEWELLKVDPDPDPVDRSVPAVIVDGPPSLEDVAWLACWWPVDDPDLDILMGLPAEVGRLRDEAWADVVRRLDGSLAVAVDYHHTREQRLAGMIADFTTSAWRDGRRVDPPLLDGSCDFTAWVALDACAAAGVAAGADRTLLTTQREALHRLGVRPVQPPQSLAAIRPVDYIKALDRAGTALELVDPRGLGRYGWLEQSRGL